MKQLLCYLMLAACPSWLLAQTGDPILPEDPWAGAEVFVAKKCAVCHSIKGEEIAARPGPNLGNIHLKGSLLDIAAVMWNHAPGMLERMGEAGVQNPRFTAKEMANLIAFLTAYQYYLKQLGHPGSSKSGEELWSSKKCDACHSFERDWAKSGPSMAIYKNVSPIKMAQSMWNHGPEMVKAMHSQRVPLPKFAENEMLDLISYIRSRTGHNADEVYVEPGNPNRGVKLFQEKRCIVCHSEKAGSNSRAPNLVQQKKMLDDVSYIAGSMWNHSVGMWEEMKRRNIPIPKFQDGEMADLIAYLYLINYYDPPGDPLIGRDLFRKKNCSYCHRWDSETGIGPNLAKIKNLDSPLAAVAAMWNHIPEMSKRTREAGVPWPRIHPGEMRDLMAYLLSQRRRSR